MVIEVLVESQGSGEGPFCCR